jgi:hypothetical protein
MGRRDKSMKTHKSRWQSTSRVSKPDCPKYELLMQATTLPTAASKHKLKVILSTFLCETSLILPFNFTVAYNIAKPDDV